MGEWWDQQLEQSGENWWDTTSREHQDWWIIEGGEPSDWWQLFDTQGVTEGEWVEGVSKSLPIVWYEILDWIPVDPDREIVSITVRPETQGHPSGGHFDAFGVFRSLLTDKLYGMEEETIALEAVSSYPKKIPLFPAVTDRQIKAVYIMAESTATPTGTVAISVVNEATSGTVCTATIRDVEGDELEAYVPRMLGGISSHGDMRAGQGLSLELVLTEGSSFTIDRSRIVVLWDVADWGEE